MKEDIDDVGEKAGPAKSDDNVIVQNEGKAERPGHSRSRSYMKLPDYADPAVVARKAAELKEKMEDEAYVEKASCCICFSGLANCVIMNCGHGGICFDCGKSILQSTQACHLCRDVALFVLEMDLTNTHDNFINVKCATYLDDSESDEEQNNDPSSDAIEGNQPVEDS